MKKSQDSVVAGMVLYNSDYDRMIECLRSLSGQVKSIIVYDNSPYRMSSDKIHKIETDYKCVYIYSTKNIGMPEAMNRIMEIAEKMKAEWVLTMNADSIIPNNMIEVYRKYFGNKKIGMICPQVIDKRRKYMVATPN